MDNLQALKTRVKTKAGELGFNLFGITTPEPPPHTDVYRAWVDAGRHAGMGYMASERARSRRANPRLILPTCRSIIVTGTYYDPPAGPQPAGAVEARVAAYAVGEDYHRTLVRRMEALAAYIEEQLGRPFAHRIYTDTGPLLERELAMRAGLGWIGKNTCLIHPSGGSYLLLAEMLLELDLPPDTPFDSDHCGTCTRCIEACPTACILPDRTLDAGRCISYLTIEEKGTIPTELRNRIGAWLFGCDVCQQVCPWNLRFARSAPDPAFAPRGILDPLQLHRFLELEAGSWRSELRDSPLERPRRMGLVRNAAVVAGNTGRADLLDRLEMLMMKDEEEIVREHAAWAIARIAGARSVETLKRALASEPSEQVREGIQRALSSISRR
ncbi:MAG: tRNA epoxyqueuosine(34) reductase QueG [Anaerolineales bacterium]|jgi:epoxyqueuosine reductase